MPRIRLRTAISFVAALALVAGCNDELLEPDDEAFGGSIVVGLPQVGTLDPPRVTGLPALSILRTACDGVVGLEAGNPVPQPALAEQWSLSSVARLLKVQLREGLQFQDGTPVTSSAVREALSRVARPGTDSPWSSLVSKVEGFGEVVTGEATSLSGVRIIDETSFEVRLSVPASEFPTVLSHPALTPVSLESIREQPEGADLPVCAGPYRVRRDSGDQDFRLGKVSEYQSRNDAYLNSGRGLAEVILIRAYDSQEDAYQAYVSNEVDLAPVPDSRLGEAQASEGDLHSGPTTDLTYLGFAPAGGPTADPRVRRAISLSIDRLAIIEAVYGDGRDPAERWLDPGYGSGIPQPCAQYLSRIDDPQRAQAQLAEAAVDPTSVEIPLYHSDQGRGRLVAEAVQVQVKQVLGVDVTPAPVRRQSVEEAYSSEDPSIWLLSTRVELPLPDQFLGDPFRTGGKSNILGFSDPGFDDSIHAAERSSSPEEAARLYLEAESRLCDLMPGIPLWRAVGHWAVDTSAVVFEGNRVLGSLGVPILRHARAAGA
ncbi:MAG: ABC transporter substrate-binding protein [Actinobacteria bacterium]|nr:ABC transporter substrate-binding protein [Actinomycetota bacterium]